MIEWQCNFNIPGSSVQLNTAYVKVLDYQNINDTCVVNFVISDYTGETVVKEFQQEFERTFRNTNEIYQEVLKDYPDATLV